MELERKQLLREAASVFSDCMTPRIDGLPICHPERSHSENQATDVLWAPASVWVSAEGRSIPRSA